MKKLVLLRHGQSIWNKENRFNGWTDVDLSQRGVVEARHAGRLLADAGFAFDIVYTSMLKRAIKTAWYVLDEMGLEWVPIEKSWRLNERHFGSLEGMDKNETIRRLGEEQVLTWSRSYDVAPPPIKVSDYRYAGVDPRYKTLDVSQIPVTESLKNTVNRMMPYWLETIVPSIQANQQVLIVGHNDSLRAMVKILDVITDDDISMVNIPTGVPLIYELDDDLNALHNQYLGEHQIKFAALS